MIIQCAIDIMPKLPIFYINIYAMYKIHQVGLHSIFLRQFSENVSCVDQNILT